MTLIEILQLKIILPIWGGSSNFCPNCNKDKEGVDTHFVPIYTYALWIWIDDSSFCFKFNKVCNKWKADKLRQIICRDEDKCLWVCLHFRDIYKQRVILTKNDLIYATVKINGCINAKMLLVKTNLVDKILETYFALWLQTRKSIILHRCRLFRSKYKILQIQVKLFCLYFKIHKVDTKKGRAGNSKKWLEMWANCVENGRRLLFVWLRRWKFWIWEGSLWGWVMVRHTLKRENNILWSGAPAPILLHIVRAQYFTLFIEIVVLSRK